MSRTWHNGERRIRVKGVKRDAPDLRRLGRALIEFARMQAEAEAESGHSQGKPATAKKSPPTMTSNKGKGPGGHKD